MNTSDLENIGSESQSGVHRDCQPRRCGFLRLSFTFRGRCGSQISAEGAGLVFAYFGRNGHFVLKHGRTRGRGGLAQGLLVIGFLQDRQQGLDHPLAGWRVVAQVPQDAMKSEKAKFDFNLNYPNLVEIIVKTGRTL